MRLLLILSVILTIVFLTVLGFIIIYTFSNHSDPGVLMVSYYPEESYLLDYCIKEDVIRIRYSLCFENHRDYDQVISAIATFNSKKGFDYHNNYHLYPENSKTSYFKIAALEKNNYILVVEKEFSEDKLDIDFSPPTHVIYVYATEEALE
ncbi:MAG: hypothetical protein IKJ91_00650 [Clostridia bacterium]|nr:hypothetical protein [Clostridia bacterium]